MPMTMAALRRLCRAGWRLFAAMMWRRLDRKMSRLLARMRWWDRQAKGGDNGSGS
jgi:hypothetical protein